MPDIALYGKYRAICCVNADASAARRRRGGAITLSQPSLLPSIAMRTSLLRTWTAVLFLLLAGCSGNPVRSTATAVEVSEKAIVILSVSHDISAKNGANAIFYLNGGQYSGRVVMRSMQDVLGVPTESDYADRRGHLYIIELAPGRHQIDGWQVASAGVRIGPKVRSVPLVFEVAKGEVLYLGNLHAQLGLGHRTLFGGRAANQAAPFVVDQRDQDITLAEARTPALKGRARVALLPIGLWGKDEETVKKLDPIIVPVTSK